MGNRPGRTPRRFILLGSPDGLRRAGEPFAHPQGARQGDCQSAVRVFVRWMAGAVAVALVLADHGGIPGMTGGFLGVTCFSR